MSIFCYKISDSVQRLIDFLCSFSRSMFTVQCSLFTMDALIPCASWHNMPFASVFVCVCVCSFVVDWTEAAEVAECVTTNARTQWLAMRHLPAQTFSVFMGIENEMHFVWVICEQKQNDAKCSIAVNEREWVARDESQNVFVSGQTKSIRNNPKGMSTWVAFRNGDAKLHAICFDPISCPLMFLLLHNSFRSSESS